MQPSLLLFTYKLVKVIKRAPYSLEEICNQCSVYYFENICANFCDSSLYLDHLQYKLAVIAALVASASAFAPSTQITRSTAIGQHIGAGGMADTRNPDAKDDEDPRKSISAAPSFEEYLKQRAAEDGK